jgi:type III restriction enzyme
VLQPNDPQNYYRLRGLVPRGLEGLLGKAQIIITNYHSFLLKDAKEIKGVARTTRQILLAGKKDDPFKETEAAMVSRVLRGFGGGKAVRRDRRLQRRGPPLLHGQAHHG